MSSSKFSDSNFPFTTTKITLARELIPPKEGALHVFDGWRLRTYDGTIVRIEKINGKGLIGVISLCDESQVREERKLEIPWFKEKILRLVEPGGGLCPTLKSDPATLVTLTDGNEEAAQKLEANLSDRNKVSQTFSSEESFFRFMSGMSVHVSRIAEKYFVFFEPRPFAWLSRQTFLDSTQGPFPTNPISACVFPPKNTAELTYLLRLSPDERLRARITKDQYDTLSSYGVAIAQEFRSAAEYQVFLREIMTLSRSGHLEISRALINNLVARLDHPIVTVFEALSIVIREAPKGTLRQGDYIKILKVLSDYIQKIVQNKKAKLIEIREILQVTGDLLDAMVDANIEGIDRDVSQQPLYKTLDSLLEKDEVRCLAAYNIQALIRVPSDESKVREILRRVISFGKGVGDVVAAVTNNTMQHLFNAYNEFTEAATSIPNPEPWYRQIHFMQALLKGGHFPEFRRFVYVASFLENEYVSQKLSYILFEMAKFHSNLNMRKEAVSYLLFMLVDEEIWGINRDRSNKKGNDFLKELICRQLKSLAICNDSEMRQFVREQLSKLSPQLKDHSRAKIYFDKYFKEISTLPVEEVPPVTHAIPLFDRVKAKEGKLALFQRMREVHDRRLRDRDMVLSEDKSLPIGLEGKEADLESTLNAFVSEQEPFAEGNPMLQIEENSSSSSFAQHVEERLWSLWNIGAPIPLLIPYHPIKSIHERIVEALKGLGFLDKEIEQLRAEKLSFTFVLERREPKIYQELKGLNGKIVVVCRPETSHTAPQAGVVRAQVELSKSADLHLLIEELLSGHPRDLTLEESLSVITGCIDMGRKQAQTATGKDLVICIGNTGAGKSTLINWLSGCTMKWERVKGAMNKVVTVVSPEDGGAIAEVMPIGHAEKSKTFMPQVTENPKLKLNFCDSPGFSDNRGVEINTANAVNTRNLLLKSASAKVVVLIDYASFTAVRGKGLRELTKICSDFFGSLESFLAHKESVLVGVSQVQDDTELLAIRDWMSGSEIPGVKELASRTFIIDPVNRKIKGAWSRDEVIAQIRKLVPIANPSAVFKTVLTSEDRMKLVEMSQKIGESIQGALSDGDFRKALFYYEQFARLEAIDHPIISVLLKQSQIHIEREIFKAAVAFKDFCVTARFAEAQELLKQLEAIKDLPQNMQGSIVFADLQTYLYAWQKKHGDDERIAEANRRQIDGGRVERDQLLKIIAGQKEHLAQQLEAQRAEFVQIILEMETRTKRQDAALTEQQRLLREDVARRLAEMGDQISPEERAAQLRVLDERIAEIEEDKRKLVGTLQEDRKAREVSLAEQTAKVAAAQAVLDQKKHELEEQERQKVLAAQKADLEQRERALQQQQEKQRREEAAAAERQRKAEAAAAEAERGRRAAEERRRAAEAAAQEAEAQRRINTENVPFVPFLTYIPPFTQNICMSCNESLLGRTFKVNVKLEGNGELHGAHVRCLGKSLLKWAKETKERASIIRSIPMITILSGTSAEKITRIVTQRVNHYREHHPEYPLDMEDPAGGFLGIIENDPYRQNGLEMIAWRHLREFFQGIPQSSLEENEWQARYEDTPVVSFSRTGIYRVVTRLSSEEKCKLIEGVAKPVCLMVGALLVQQMFQGEKK